MKLLVDHIDQLRAAFAQVKQARPFRLDAVVVLPDHLHGIWTLPPNDADFSTRWRLIKAHFSRSIASGERLSQRRRVKNERGIWQRRFWERTIRSEEEFAALVDYIHFNPVKHGHVTQTKDWPYSSFHRYVREGRLPLDWGAAENTALSKWPVHAGERQKKSPAAVERVSEA